MANRKMRQFIYKCRFRSIPISSDDEITTAYNPPQLNSMQKSFIQCNERISNYNFNNVTRCCYPSINKIYVSMCCIRVFVPEKMRWSTKKFVHFELDNMNRPIYLIQYPFRMPTTWYWLNFNDPVNLHSIRLVSFHFILNSRNMLCVSSNIENIGHKM